jgi:ketosteroid isomerase-like protein
VPPGHARRIQLGEAAAEFALPNIVVLTVRNGQIARLHDYVNVLAAHEMPRTKL